MKASDAAVLAFVTWLSYACAEGYGAPKIGSRNNAVLTPSTAGMMSDAPIGGSAAAMSTGGAGGVPAPAGDPCVQGDVMSCPCEGTAALGERRCLNDMASPNLTDGFFSECMGCPPPTPPDDGMPDPATMCSDCTEDICIDGVCTVPPSGGVGGASGTGGSGGSSGASGEGGSGGEEEPTPQEPVEDCDGVPEGTECDRDCILPSNTARCNSRGNCSCLG